MSHEAKFKPIKTFSLKELENLIRMFLRVGILRLALGVPLNFIVYILQTISFLYPSLPSHLALI